MEIPKDELVADMVKLLEIGLREEFEGRAGAIEFDAQMLHSHAECLALLDLLQRPPGVLTGVNDWSKLTCGVDGPPNGGPKNSGPRERPRLAALSGAPN